TFAGKSDRSISGRLGQRNSRHLQRGTARSLMKWAKSDERNAARDPAVDWMGPHLAKAGVGPEISALSSRRSDGELSRLDLKSGAARGEKSGRCRLESAGAAR